MMNRISSYLAFFLLSAWTVQADFCQEISSDLAEIIERTEGISGRFTEVLPFPDQGGSFINQVYLVYTDQGEQLVLKVENPNWKNEKTLNEVNALKYLNSKTSIPVPKILGYENAVQQSPFKHEYILMTCMKGSPLNHQFDQIYTNRLLYVHLLE